MQNNKTDIRNTIVGIIVILLVVGLVIVLLRWLFAHIKQEVAASLIVGILTAVAAIWTARSTKLKDREMQIQAQQSQRREEIATGFMEGFWDIVQGDFKSEKEKEEYIKSILKDFMVKGSLWSSDRTLKTFVAFRLDAQRKAGDSDMARHLAKLILSFRADLGHQNRGLSEKDILDVFINDTGSVFKRD